MDAVRGVLGDDTRALARSLGGLVLAVSVLVVLFRRTSFGDPWGELPVFLVLAATAAGFYASGLWAAKLGSAPHAWHTIYVVLGLVFIPVALTSFLDLVGGDTNSSLNGAWILALTAVAGFGAALLAGVRYGCLFGSIALVFAWLLLWDSIVSDGLAADIGTLRGLLVVIAVILVVVAMLFAARESPPGAAADTLTGAGIAAVAAGAISVVAVANFGLLGLVSGTPAGSSVVEASAFWDLELLLASLALVLAGVLTSTRGPVYIGAIGLLIFTFTVGLDLDDASPAGSLEGWPLLLLIVGAGLVVFSALPALARRRRSA